MVKVNKQNLDILIEQEVKQKKLTNAQIWWFNKCVKGEWKLENGVINVVGNVYCNNQNLTSIPIQFGYINGHFYCNDNELTSLKGCPYEVEREFLCYNNKLTSLDYIPTNIGTIIYCYDNPFILNDKLFEDLAKIGKNKIQYPGQFFNDLKEQIPIQFGITDQTIIDDIWQSYMNILEDKN